MEKVKEQEEVTIRKYSKEEITQITSKLITTFKRVFYPLHTDSGLSYSDDIDTFSLDDLELFMQTNTLTAGVEENY